MSKDNNSERKFYYPIRLSSRFVVIMQLALSARDYENCVTNDKNSLNARKVIFIVETCKTQLPPGACRSSHKSNVNVHNRSFISEMQLQ